MKEELAKQLAAWLERLSAGADFVVAQAPSIVQERLLFGRISETFYFAVGVIGCALFAFAIHRHIARAKAEAGAHFDMIDDANPCVVLPSFFGVVLCGVFAAVKVEALILVWFAPRIYIINWLRGLL